MKKIFPLIPILILILLLSMSTTVLAQENTEREQQVTASYVPGEVNTDVISVDIQWNNMSFTYKGASESVWDADKHEYTGQSTEAGWEASDAVISITNHSNVILQAQIDYTPEDSFSGISMHFTDAEPYIGSADTSDDGTGTACCVTVLVIPDGELPSNTADNTKIGTIRVRVETVEDAAAVMEAMEAKFGQIPVGEQSRRGSVYFETSDAAVEVGDMIDVTNGVVYNGENTDAEKNAAVNQLLVAFYSALKIEQ